MHLGCIIASTTKAPASSDGSDECEQKTNILSCLIKYTFGLHICDEKLDEHNVRLSCYLCICLLHVHIKPYFRKHALAFMNMSLAYSDLRGNILYEVVSSFMLLGIYSIIMSHKLDGGQLTQHTCMQPRFAMATIATLLVKAMKPEEGDLIRPPVLTSSLFIAP